MKHKFPGEDEDWGWHTLGFLPHGVLQRLKVEFVTIDVFYNAFDDVDGARELLIQVLSEASWQATGDRLLAELVQWRTQVHPKVRRVRKIRCQQMSETLAIQQDSDATRAATEFEDIIKNDPFHALEVAKRKCKMLKKSTTGTTRAEKEAASLEKYTAALGAVVQEAHLPVCRYIDQLHDPNRAWARLFGARRSNTLRNRLRAWNRFRGWLLATYYRVWPLSAVDLINYVEEVRGDSGSRSLPGELQAALVVLETCGRVPEGERISRDQLWLQHQASWRVESETGAAPVKSARPYTLAVMLALELAVMDMEYSFYMRLICWTVLLAAWGTMRMDDVQCVLPQSLKLSRRGLTLRLARTKTTGPGKLHGQCHVFVNRCCCLSGEDWMSEGFRFWELEQLCYPRDYLIPHPTENWQGVRKKLLEPPDLANFVRMALQQLGTPKMEDGLWRLNKQMSLVPDHCAMFWSGHSARHFLPVLTAAIGCSKPDRDFLGRWAIGRVGSNAYMLTSRQIVERLQQQSVKSILEGSPEYIEDELLDELKVFADANGFVGHRVRRRHSLLFTMPLQSEDLSVPESDSEELKEGEVESLRKEALSEWTVETDEMKELESPCYFLTVSRRTGFRRLHVVGACQIQRERCQETVNVDDMEKAEFNAVCKWCKKHLEKDKSSKTTDSTDSSGSSGDSSSTDAETSEEHPE